MLFHFTPRIPAILLWSSANATCIYDIDYELRGIALYWHHQLYWVGIIISKVSTKALPGSGKKQWLLCHLYTSWTRMPMLSPAWSSFSNHHHACCKDLFIQQPTSMLTKISIKEESSIEQLITLQSSINYHVRETWEEVDWPSDAPQHLPWACQDHRDQEGRAGVQFLWMLTGKF